MAVLKASPVRTLIAGAAAQVALFIGLALVTGLGPSGWLTGIAYLVIGCAAITTGLRRYGVTAFGPADLVTLARAVLIGGVTVLVSDIPEPVPVTPMVVLAAVALSLDAVDGRVARHTGTVSRFGARFDMETDAFLILVLSAYLATNLGPWVLAIGVMRYVFVVAGRLLPWLRAELPHSMIRKTIAAAQGIILAFAAAELLPETGNVLILGLALAALVWSFGYDVAWLYRHRADAPTETTETTEPAEEAPARSTRRRVLAGVGTGLAVALVLFALIAPNRLSHFSPAAFARIPIEALIITGLVLVLPAVARRVAAVIIGLSLGLLLIVKLTDIGFNEVLARPFDLVFDWSFLRPGVDYLADSVGQLGAVLAVIGACLLVVGTLVLMTIAALRLSRQLVSRRPTVTRNVAVLGVVWLVCAVLGVQFTTGTPVASRAASDTVYDEAKRVHAGLLDPEQFAKEASVDRFRYTPGEELLTGLRGKDVLLNFIESYGRVAVEDPLISPGVDAKLDAGTAKLKAAGFQTRSAFLSSSTFGGGSWLAHASIQSGLWINNQQRYDALTAGNRMSLTKAFKRAGWDTFGASPQINRDWPEGEYFGYDKMYTQNNIDYQGPAFAYSRMPDQWLLQYLQNTQRGKPGHRPVMGEIDLTSSHSPWAPLPKPVDWKQLGDGKVFETATNGKKGKNVWPDPTKVKRAYGQSIEYVLETLISYAQTYGDKNLVMIFLGDHQPAPIVSGEDATHDVPITIVAKDPAVIKRIAKWGWQEGLNPAPNAPVWKMSKFRDRFLTAFGPGRSSQHVAASGK
ncbi:MAG TPA: CDP-alcohol phosphatidyltransferase family protein [Actinophytocola sp.]|uniref:CDP-alcohol phosphatidyltransferase family protein n=1 Tax=Actinophytocola sp. TaxID=1872138 RepID=UPI002F91D25F